MKRLRPRDLILAPASVLYGLVVSSRAGLYGAGILPRRRLKGRVVSVGNLTVGGTGKTPAIIALAKLLRAPGRRLGVLTRGYGRRADEVVILKGVPGSWGERRSTVKRAGDEPVLLARRLPEVPIGVAADRLAAGRQLEEEHAVTLFLLDDAFQHLRLHRDADIVLLDATASDDALLPRGRRREPWSALRRAHIVLITRTEQADPAPLVERVRAANPAAAIFCARTVLESVRDAATDSEVSLGSLKGKRWLAFCGIGNDRAFVKNLADWGFQLEGVRRFPDHHRYEREDLMGLLRAADEAGSEALVTTEKDIVNWHLAGPAPMPIYYCRIALGIDQADQMVAAIGRRLEGAS